MGDRSVSASSQQADAQRTAVNGPEKCDGEAKHRTPLKRTKGRWSRMLVLTPTLNTSTRFSFIRRDTLRPTYGPPTFKIVVAKPMLSGQLLVSKYPWIEDSTSPRNPLIERTFITSRRIVPLWVVQLLLTSPGDPTSRCDQNESQWRLSSTCTDTEKSGSC